MKKTGLGKGLDALFADNLMSNEEEMDESTEKIHKIKVIEIEPNREQPRRSFDEEALDELATSIKTYGVLQPIIVNKKDDYYEIVAGERRFRASKLAGLSEIPALVKNITDENAMEIALIENVQRENLNPIEEAAAYKNLMEKCEYELLDVARLIGKSESYIRNAVRLMDLPSEVKDMVEKGRLSASHARTIAVAEDPVTLAKEIIENKMSVAETERKVKNTKRSSNSRAYVSKTMDDETVLDIEKRLRNALGVPVKLQEKKGGAGQIVLGFSTRVQLQELIEKLMK